MAGPWGTSHVRNVVIKDPPSSRLTQRKAGAGPLAIVAYEVPGMLRDKLCRELIVFAVLVSAGFVLAVLLIVEAPVPNPLKGIEYPTERVVDLVQGRQRRVRLPEQRPS